MHDAQNILASWGNDRATGSRQFMECHKKTARSHRVTVTSQQPLNDSKFSSLSGLLNDGLVYRTLGGSQPFDEWVSHMITSPVYHPPQDWEMFIKLNRLTVDSPNKNITFKYNPYIF